MDGWKTSFRNRGYVTLREGMFYMVVMLMCSCEGQLLKLSRLRCFVSRPPSPKRSSPFELAICSAGFQQPHLDGGFVPGKWEKKKQDEQKITSDKEIIR